MSEYPIRDPYVLSLVASNRQLLSTITGYCHILKYYIVGSLVPITYIFLSYGIMLGLLFICLVLLVIEVLLHQTMKKMDQWLARQTQIIQYLDSKFAFYKTQKPLSTADVRAEVKNFLKYQDVEPK